MIEICDQELIEQGSDLVTQLQNCLYFSKNWMVGLPFSSKINICLYTLKLEFAFLTQSQL